MASERINEAVKKLQLSFDRVMGKWLEDQQDWLDKEGYGPDEVLEILRKATRK